MKTNEQTTNQTTQKMGEMVLDPLGIMNEWITTIEKWV